MSINPNEDQYLNMARDIFNRGERMEQRAVTADGLRPYCLSIFGYQLRMDLGFGFPLLTTKKMSFKAVAAELLWFLSGSTNSKDLENMGARIWSAWADENGELGSVYGKHWRDWVSAERYTGDEGGDEWEVTRTDQISDLQKNIAAVLVNPNHPSARRLVLINYNPGDLPPKAPPGCHTMVQFSVRKGRIDCSVYMRSADTFLGVPYNIASYALLTHLLCNVFDQRPGYLVFSFGDVHIYSNHVEQMSHQIDQPTHAPPYLFMPGRLPSILGAKMEDFELKSYTSHKALTGDIAI